MIPNVVTIKRHQKSRYPTLWPTEPEDVVVHDLYRQQPSTGKNVEETYYFALKEDTDGPLGSIIFTGEGSVLYQTGSASKTDATKFRDWFGAHQRACNEWADTGFRGSIVGKLDDPQEPKRMLVYYVIQQNTVYLDVPSIDRLAGIRDKTMADTLLAMPVERLTTVNIDKATQSVVSRELPMTGSLSKGAPYVALPVVLFEPRTSTDGSEGAPPRLITSDVHMTFMAYKSATSRG